MLPLLLLTALSQAPESDPRVAATMTQLKVLRRSDLKLPDLTGDFDGDGKPDHAVAVVLAKGKDRGVLVLWGSGKPAVLLGATADFNHFRDHDFDQWEIRKAKGRPKRDVMVWTWSEKASARIAWNGKRFAWKQEGD